MVRRIIVSQALLKMAGKHHRILWFIAILVIKYFTSLSLTLSPRSTCATSYLEPRPIRFGTFHRSYARQLDFLEDLRCISLQPVAYLPQNAQT